MILPPTGHSSGRRPNLNFLYQVFELWCSVELYSREGSTAFQSPPFRIDNDTQASIRKQVRATALCIYATAHPPEEKVTSCPISCHLLLRACASLTKATTQSSIGIVCSNKNLQRCGPRGLDWHPPQILLFFGKF